MPPSSRAGEPDLVAPLGEPRSAFIAIEASSAIAAAPAACLNDLPNIPPRSPRPPPADLPGAWRSCGASRGGFQALPGAAGVVTGTLAGAAEGALSWAGT